MIRRIKSGLNSNTQRGISLIELMVSITLFSIVSAGVVAYISDSLRRLSTETRAALFTTELKNAVGLLQSEMRMSSAVSPYNVGINANLVNCTSQLAVTSTTVRFFVTHDDPSGPSGTRAYYVGYEYSPSDNTLYRGEVPAPSTTACTLPGSDPLSAANKKVLARNIVRIDADNNSTIDPAFQRTGNQFFIRFGAQVTGPGGLEVTQKVTNTVFTRAT